MLFNSLQYAGFLLVVVVAYWTIPKAYRRHLLLVASYVFYGSWDWRLLGLLLIATGGSWLAGRSIPGTSGGLRKAYAAAGIVSSLGVLAGFRLYGFFAGSASVSSVPTAFGGAAVKVAIPVGLSFIAFQAISYVVDVYRAEIPPASSLLDFALYVAFFPHLLAGPIMRASKLIPSFHQTADRPDKIQMTEAAELILVGIFKKVVIADPIVGLVTRQAADLKLVNTSTMWMMWMAGLIAAYFDITGYIDIARGSALMLGIRLQPNAIQPLLRSTSLADFWRRWQVTVMMWFRDYVYLPVRGRKRPTERRELFALLVSFVALGLWHGTGVNWIIWGALTGGIVTAERLVQTRRAAARRAAAREARRADRPRRPAPDGGDGGRGGSVAAPSRTLTAKATPPSPVAAGLKRARQLLYVFLVLVATLPWIGSPTIHDTLQTYKVLVIPRGNALPAVKVPHALPAWHRFLPVADVGWFLLLGIISLILLDTRERVRQERSGRPDPPTIWRAVGFAAMIVGIIIFSGTPSQPFLYFRF